MDQEILEAIEFLKSTPISEDADPLPVNDLFEEPEEEELDAVEFLKQVGIRVVESQTQPTKAGKQPRPVWNIEGVTEPYEYIMYEYLSIKVKKWRGVISCFEDPTEELADLIAELGPKSFAEQQEGKMERAANRASRLQERAKKHRSIANSYRNEADRLSQRFYMGQPILVGHHSEKSARRDQQKMWDKTRKSIDETNYAEHLQERAEGNLAKAEGEHLTPTYIGNRLEECRAELREVMVKINGGRLGPRSQEWTPATGDRLHQLTIQKQQLEEKIDYWQTLLDEKGGTVYSSENVKTGDWVKYRGRWHQVYRANKKTVSLHFFSHTQGWTNSGNYYELSGHCPKLLALAYAKEEYNIDLSECHETKIPLSQAKGWLASRGDVKI